MEISKFLYIFTLFIHPSTLNITNKTPHSPDDGSAEPKRYSVDWLCFSINPYFLFGLFVVNFSSQIVGLLSIIFFHIYMCVYMCVWEREKEREREWERKGRTYGKLDWHASLRFKFNTSEYSGNKKVILLTVYEMQFFPKRGSQKIPLCLIRSNVLQWPLN